ncbi:hypothetical protein SCUP234_06110 [Seiridium cupressi]
MSTGEEQELLAQINRLEGRISKHKAQQTAPSHSRGTFRAAPYHRGGGYRGSRGQAPTYRNKTLVLNGQNGQHRDATANSNAAGSGSWVSRTDRHLQLINSSVFEKDSQARASAIEETQRQKRLRKEQAEKNRFLNYVQQYASSAAPTSPSTPASRYEITVEGIRFQITKQGSKLVRAPDDNNPPSATPRITLIGGVKFYRTKNGNLVRHGIAKAQRMAGGIKKINIPCKTFSWTGIVFSPKSDLLRSRQIMRYSGMTDPVCRDFGFNGYCERGAKCPDRHVFECPDFSNTGICKTKGCKLLHRERASVLRSKAGNNNDEDMADLSSDEDEGAAPDDIDSDEVEEFIGHDDVDELDFDKDYIRF